MISSYDRHMIKLNTNRMRHLAVVNAKSMIECTIKMIDVYYPNHKNEPSITEALTELNDSIDNFDFAKDHLDKIIKKQEEEIPKVIDET